MTAEPHHHYDDLHRLVDRLTPVQAEAVQAVVLHLVTSEPDQGEGEGDQGPMRHFPFAGSISAEPDYATRSSEILEEMVRRNAG